ncbi:MAG: hypothetical protein HYX69_02240 [Planctomycetia bacterium]|nr:hypothetical protein [Planctomycetia bacterium]
MTYDPSSIRRAAILVATLDAATADGLLAQMPSDQAVRVRQAIDELAEVDAAEEAAILEEFLGHGGVGSRHAPPSPVADGVEWQLAERPRAEGSSAGAEPSSEFLNDTPCADLVALLERERPQTICVVVSRLSPIRAQRVLAALAPALRADVMRRLIDLDRADAEAIKDVERGLHFRVVECLESEQARAVGLAQVAQLVDRAEPALKQQILANLADHDAQLAAQVDPRRLEFADLELLPAARLAALARAVDRQVLLLALAGASREFVRQVQRQLPSSEVKSLRRSLANLGPTRLADVEEAQRQLVSLAQRVRPADRAAAIP